ncbi:hypothetical protein M3194_03845 [Paenibacillus glycanilyticus]|uniref:hypothetical protein n=1 Tax=Paenibacillus glycanilyticus TaxID=126569 RepID=UPI00203B9CF0|nr:hypothetical protein [Paenibacillus glycanilyticus]MCM3626500.1 hypothetical protein [Paenibacillus glycanilyticus]
MIRISSLTEKGFNYHALPQGVQMLDNMLTMQLEGAEEEISARLSFSFQSREWTIDHVMETDTVFEFRPELLAEGNRLIARIDEMNRMSDEEFDAAYERGEFKDMT